MRHDIMTPGAFIWSVIRPYKYFYCMMMIAPICSGVYPILYNYSVKLLIDLFTTSDHITFQQAFAPIIWFIMAQIVLDGGWRLHDFAQLKSLPYVFQSMMHKICQHVFYLPQTYFQNNLSGSINSKIRGIGDHYGKMHSAIEYKLSRPLLITIFSGVALFCVNSKIFWFVCSFTIIYSLFAFRFFIELAKMEQAKQNSWHYLFGTIADRIQNIANIFAFATRKNEIKNIQNYYKEIHNPLTIKYYKYDFVVSIILSLLYWVLLISIFIFIIYLKNTQAITVGDIAFLVSITYLFAENSWHLTIETKDFLEDVAAFRAAFSIMQIPICVLDHKDGVELNVSKGEIIFENVSFNYENGDSVFADLNLHIKAGQKVGLVGHSGAGKSTIISLLLKNFKVTKGNIYIDKQSIYDVSADSLRSNIALIPQDIILFHRSIGDNIGYANKNATQIEIEQAAKMANIHEFILKLPEGYNTLVGERGIKLSGGQRQRIAIARAVLKKSKILILDEATSSLDSQTENDIQKSIHKIFATNKVTIIAIAHRLSTVKNMDRIVVFHNGKIVEDGTFTELIGMKNGKFKELWQHQVNGMLI